MIISHRYKYIFLKTNKTAGTSIEIALSEFCDDDDIITPISPPDEDIRRSLGYRGPQNYQPKDLNSRGFYNHMSAEKAKKYLGQETWNNYFKFCFERNPWDRIVSLYYWRCQSEPRPTIAEFLDSDVPLVLRKKGYDLYTINDRIAVDRVCRFENLLEELESVRKKLGIPGKLTLPRAKARHRKDKRSYREILGEQEKVKISELFADEINLHGYRF